MTQVLKSLYMKPTIYKRFAIVITAGLMAACSATTPEDNKQARLEKLKADRANLTKEIQRLEAEIAAENPEAATARAKEVAVSTLSPRAFDHYVQTQARVESENNILVSSKSPGVITQVYVKEGDVVTKGQVMAQLDNSLVLRTIESIKTQLELANSVYERQKNLWDQKIGTELQYLQAKNNKESLERQLASAQEQNDMTRIKAPIDGVVDEVHIKVGENINPGMPAVRVVNASRLKLVSNVSEAHVTSIKKGNKVLVNIAELGKEIQAKVTFVGRTIDPLSRTFAVEAELPADPDLRPNMTASVRIIFHSEPSAIVVPVNVIQTVNGEKIVYIAENQGNQLVARKKVVNVGGVYGGMAQVTGLSGGDRIITVGYQSLNDGDIIKI